MLTAVLVSAPLALWDWRAFVHSAGTVQKLAPFREDALSYLVWFYHRTGHKGDVGAGFVAMLIAMGLALWRCPRDPAGFASALALVYLPFISINKQAFANYYLFVIGALCCAVAAAEIGAQRHPRRAPPDHRLADQDSIDLDDLRSEPRFRNLISSVKIPPPCRRSWFRSAFLGQKLA